MLRTVHARRPFAEPRGLNPRARTLPLRPYVKDAQKYVVACRPCAVKRHMAVEKRMRRAGEVRRDDRPQPRGDAAIRRSASSPPARATSTSARPSRTPACSSSGMVNPLPVESHARASPRRSEKLNRRRGTGSASSRRVCAQTASAWTAARTAFGLLGELSQSRAARGHGRFEQPESAKTFGEPVPGAPAGDVPRLPAPRPVYRAFAR